MASACECVVDCAEPEVPERSEKVADRDETQLCCRDTLKEGSVEAPPPAALRMEGWREMPPPLAALCTDGRRECDEWAIDGRREAAAAAACAVAMKFPTGGSDMAVASDEATDVLS